MGQTKVKPKKPDTEYILYDSIYGSTKTGKTNLCCYKSESDLGAGYTVYRVSENRVEHL